MLSEDESFSSRLSVCHIDFVNTCIYNTAASVFKKNHSCLIFWGGPERRAVLSQVHRLGNMKGKVSEKLGYSGPQESFFPLGVLLCLSVYPSSRFSVGILRPSARSACLSVVHVRPPVHLSVRLPFSLSPAYFLKSSEREGIFPAANGAVSTLDREREPQ